MAPTLAFFVGVMLWQQSLVSSTTCTTVTLTTQADRQTISTTGYPTSYSNNQDVCWIIDVSAVAAVGTETYVIQMDVTDTDMEKLGSSCYDYGEARDGDSSSATRLAKWCDAAPYPVVSSGSKLYMRFFSSSQNDNGAVFRGFSARMAVAVRAGVGTLASQYSPTCTPFALAATNTTYTLTSPNYPAQYNDGMDKCWVVYVDTTIAARVNYAVRLQVLDSQLEVSSTCHYDDVQARDGDESTSSLITMWCGATIPGVTVSCGPSMYIRMRSDHHSTYRGFRAFVNAISQDSQSCSLAPTGLSLGAIIGIAMGGVFLLIIIIVIVCVCVMAQKKNNVKVKHVKPRKSRKRAGGDVAMVPAPEAKHPSYYNQNQPPPYPGNPYPVVSGIQPPVPHGATMTTGYAQPAAPAYFMTNQGGMPDAY